MMDLGAKIGDMRRHFHGGSTLSVDARKKLLSSLRDAIKKHEKDILDALLRDLRKNPFEAYSTEIGFVLGELEHTLSELRDWAAPRPVMTALTSLPASSAIYPVPKGVVLILSPWNYPFQLLFAPIVAAIAAGNCCVVKPSEMAPATMAVSRKIIRDAFSDDVVLCVEGDREVAQKLLTFSFDHIFFTGSTEVGRIVARAAAEHLTPITLELGGKSPCIVDRTASIKQAAKRIVWGKFLNAGQTCVAPDYVLVHEDVRKDLVVAMKLVIAEFFGADPQKSPDYGRIINEQHFDRLAALLTGPGEVIGGRIDRSDRYIEPTIIDGAHRDHPSMKAEIFGPILPVISWREKGQIYATLEVHPNPLALYVFTNDRSFEQELIQQVPFGGGCVNHTLLHLANPELPFGGVRQSGFGAYHGKFGFETFSHLKAVVKAGTMDVPIKYPPYPAWKSKLLRLIF